MRKSNRDGPSWGDSKHDDAPGSRPGRIEQLGDFYLSQRPGRPHFYITWFDAKARQTRRLSTDTGDLEIARRHLAEHFIKCRRLDGVPLTDVAVVEILRRYYERHGKSLPSAEQIRYAIKTLDQALGDISVAGFSLAQQKRIFDQLVASGKSPSYVARIFSVAKAAILQAHLYGEISSKPSFISLPKAPLRHRTLSVNEAARLFAHADSTPMLRYLLLAFATGARPGALLDVQRDQFDFDGRLIHLNPAGRVQNKKRRPILPMPETVAMTLRELDAGLLIHHNGQGYTRNGWRSIFGRLLARAGIEGATLYTIRHTVATELHRRGVVPAEVAAYMGHSAETAFGTTGRYVHFQPEYLHSAAKAIDDYLKIVGASAWELRSPAQVEGEGSANPAAILRALSVPDPQKFHSAVKEPSSPING